MPLVSLLFHDVYRGEPRRSGFDSAAADRYKLSIPEFETQLSGVAHGAIRNRRFLPAASCCSRCLTPRTASDMFPYLITVDDGGLSCYSGCGSPRAPRVARPLLRDDELHRPAWIPHRAADSRARCARSHHRQPFRVAPDAVQRLLDSADAPGVDAQSRGLAGSARTSGQRRLGAGRLFPRWSRARRRRRAARALHIGTDDAYAHAPWMLRDRPVYGSRTMPGRFASRIVLPPPHPRRRVGRLERQEGGQAAARIDLCTSSGLAACHALGNVEVRSLSAEL